jgi:hypothetical protein
MLENQKGMTTALAILIVFIVLFGGAMAYLASPLPGTLPPSHNYFTDLSFELNASKTWRVAVPISQDGQLHLSISSEYPVQLYVKNSNSYMLNILVTGDHNYTLPVTEAMGMLEVGVTNIGSQPAIVQEFTCFWTL